MAAPTSDGPPVSALDEPPSSQITAGHEQSVTSPPKDRHSTVSLSPVLAATSSQAERNPATSIARVSSSDESALDQQHYTGKMCFDKGLKTNSVAIATREGHQVDLKHHGICSAPVDMNAEPDRQSSASKRPEGLTHHNNVSYRASKRGHLKEMSMEPGSTDVRDTMIARADHLLSGTGGSPGSCSARHGHQRDTLLDEPIFRSWDKLDAGSTPRSLRSSSKPCSVETNHARPEPCQYPWHVFEAKRQNSVASGSSFASYDQSRAYSGDLPNAQSAISSRTTTFDELDALNEPLSICEEPQAFTFENRDAIPFSGQEVIDLKDAISYMRSHKRRRSLRDRSREPVVYKPSLLSTAFEADNWVSSVFATRQSPQHSVPEHDGSTGSESGKVSAVHEHEAFSAAASEDELDFSDTDISETQGADIIEIHEHHPLFQLKCDVARQTLAGYRQCKASTAHGNDSSSTGPGNPTPGSSEGGSASKSHSSKRPRGGAYQGIREGDEEEEEEDDERPSPKRPAPDASRKAQDTPLLACPFAKKDSLKYAECYGYKLDSIARVKQHLKRAHHPKYCKRCYQVFPSDKELTAHSRAEEGCDINDGDPPGDLTETQIEKLKPHAKRGKTLTEQWHLVYGICFGEDDPKQYPDPFVYKKLGEDVQGLVDHVRQHAGEYVRRGSKPRELMEILEGLGLHTTEEQKRMIIGMVCDCARDGVTELVRVHLANVGITPGLTEGETASATSYTHKEGTGKDETPVCSLNDDSWLANGTPMLALSEVDVPADPYERGEFYTNPHQMEQQKENSHFSTATASNTWMGAAGIGIGLLDDLDTSAIYR